MSTQPESEPEPRSTSGWVGALLTVGLLVAPVTVLTTGTTNTFVMVWGLVNPTPFGSDSVVHVYPVWTYVTEQPQPFGSLPSSIQLWPVAFAFHLLAIGNAVLGAAFDREDRRVTGGLLVLAGFATLTVTLGIAGRSGVAIIGPSPIVPLGALLTWSIAIGVYGSDLRNLFKH